MMNLKGYEKGEIIHTLRGNESLSLLAMRVRPLDRIPSSAPPKFGGLSLLLRELLWRQKNAREQGLRRGEALGSNMKGLTEHYKRLETKEVQGPRRQRCEIRDWKYNSVKVRVRSCTAGAELAGSGESHKKETLALLKIRSDMDVAFRDSSRLRSLVRAVLIGIDVPYLFYISVSAIRSHSKAHQVGNPLLASRPQLQLQYGFK
ncbi:hypothetical protein Tco_1078021, partial [Tanacetum coccineum]